MKIVAGVDGSPTAEAAALKAARLAQGTGGVLHLVSAYGKLEERVIEAEAQELVLHPKDDARRIAEAAAEQLRAQFPELTVHAAPSAGKPADALLTAADEVGADLIVVGNKRVQGPTRILGSIATDVAHRAPCDVYVAHTH
ncbi:universal stress protein [Nocardioides campestrisoli]|uniref:universal stress protein n=1 Tax=Nocardioides campestrisoli TaxID=2736757 RepID=UPI0015E6AEB0|nr:universal stress protein [Nocardioides campestrisoli]